MKYINSENLYAYAFLNEDTLTYPVKKLCISFHGYTDGTVYEKALDNPYFFDTLRMFAAQQPKRDAVIFNNGLHGWHLDDETEYSERYECAVRFLTEEFSGTPIFLVMTTAVKDEERENRVEERNRVARSLAEKYRLFVIDLHGVSVANAELRSVDGFHFSREGNEKFADCILAALEAKLAL